MTALETSTLASPLLAVSKVIVIIIAIYIVAVRGQLRYSTRFTWYWFAWIIWLILEFTLFFNAGKGTGFLHTFFAPSCFLLVLYFCIMNPKAEIHFVFGFIVLYLLTGAYSLYLSFSIGTMYWDTGRLVSNLVFWPLCPFVFVPRVRKQEYQYLLIIPMVIICILLAKRSAIINVGLELFVYSLFLFRNKSNNKTWHILLYIGVIVAAAVFISSGFRSFIDSTFERFETMQSDQGSGRVEIYESSFRNIDTFSFLEILVGRGYGSIVEIGNTNAHNDALQLFYEFGLVGLFFYVALIVILFIRLKTVKKYATDYYVGYAFCVITIIVLGMFSNLIHFNSYFAFLCSYLGMTEAVIFRNRKKAAFVTTANIKWQ